MSFELTTLGEYISVQGGYAYKSQQFIQSSTYPVLKIKNIRTGYIDFNDCAYIDKKVADETERYIVNEGDILISLTGSGPNAPQSLVGRVARFWDKGKRAWINQRVGRVVLKKNKTVHKDFIFYFLGTKESQNYLVANSSGSANQANINSATIEALPFPQIDYLTSEKISQVLRTFDEKIYLNSQINQTLESIAQAIFKSWFIDFDPVRAKIAAKQEGKDTELAAMCAISGKSEVEIQQISDDDFIELQATAALFPDELVESELGEVPKGWDKYSLSKMITLIGGGTPKRSEPNYWNGDIFWFSVKDVPNEGEVFVITTQEKISELGLNKSSTKLLPVGTTIITARGTVGKIALVGYEMAMNQSCYGVQGINGVRQFMTYYLIKNAVEVLKKNTHGAVFDTITQSTFDTVTSIKPSIEMMDLFESKVEKIMGHIKNNLYENNSLIALRDTLLPKLLSGELDVSGVQDEVA
ncbi:restriction endonuclease subunit S [Acinetobacter lwoffii]|uniref:restriction endonuclease subunit S n=1 Tax=Acinetobacter lwoffii TaxID=28090 RepID=UPI001C215631|nr:restriction endonuclease subunit S [Acinetobacter lwoffii]QXB86280.1 restriction endonuclease subunit S [Acinetobacter lwoffii]